ncbi:MAG TPA: hypothetical protein VKG01_01090 [Thermoanaerobaculia bacterium]|nr:hypothetical protein [Thermoanaerobaculia bacterium]
MIRTHGLSILGAIFPALAIGQAAPASAPASEPAAPAAAGPYARIAFLKPHEGQTVDFEAGYIRHLEWHRQAKDPWTWYGWSIWAGERQRWLVYATFGHAAADFDNPVSPADDERDNVVNVVPHAEFAGNGLYEFLPALSRGAGVPEPDARVELTTVDLQPGAAKAFETAMIAARSSLRGEALWYRMAAGGPSPRYLRLRPVPRVSAVLDARTEQTLPEETHRWIAKATVEILALRPTMSYNLPGSSPK